MDGGGCDDSCHRRAGETRAAGKSTEKREGAVGAPEQAAITFLHPRHYQKPFPYLLLSPPRSPGSLSPPCVQSYGHNCPTGVEVSTETSLLGGGKGEFKKMPF